jgi:hypothetical protein
LETIKVDFLLVFNFVHSSRRYLKKQRRDRNPLLSFLPVFHQKVTGPTDGGANTCLLALHLPYFGRTQILFIATIRARSDDEAQELEAMPQRKNARAYRRTCSRIIPEKLFSCRLKRFSRWAGFTPVRFFDE